MGAKYLPILVLVSSVLAAACGKVENNARDAGAPDAGDGDGDGAPPDAGDSPTTLRVIHAIPGVSQTRLFAVDVIDGVAAEPQLLSGSFINPEARVGTFRVSADGDTVTYAADAETDGFTELFAVRVSDAAAQPVRISEDHGNNGRVLGHFLSPSGDLAIYTFGTSGSGFSFIDNYFAVDLGGETPGEPIPLGGGTLVSGGQLSADGSMFVFIEGGEAFVVDLSGGQVSAAVRISPPPAGTGTVRFVEVSADASRAVIVGDLETTGVVELFAVDLSGPTPAPAVKVNQALVDGGDVGLSSGFFAPQRLSADGDLVSFFADAATDGVIELFASDLGGASPTTPVRVNGPMDNGGAISFLSIARAGGGERIAYIGDERIDGVSELFFADLASGQPSQRVSGALVADGDVSKVAMADGGGALVYIADQRNDLVNEVFFVDLSGALPAAPVRASGDLGDGNSVSSTGLALSPDASQLAYVSDERVLGRFELMLAPVSGGTPGAAAPVQDPTNADSRISRLTFSNDGQSLVYSGNTVAAGQDLWYVDLGGAAPLGAVRINSETAAPNFGIAFELRVLP